MRTEQSKSHFVFHKDSLALSGLREELLLDISAEKGDVISVDMYGPEKIHPGGHLGYWNYKLPLGSSMVSVGIALNRISFYSVVLFHGDRKMIYADHWINPEFEFAGELNISVIIWRGGESLESRTFKVLLSGEAGDGLRKALRDIHRIDTNRLYISHFCDEEVPLPKLLVIESTSRCNLKCPMCPRTIGRSPSGKYDDLDEAVLVNLENVIRKTNSVCLSWMGEPLLNRRLPSIIEKIRSINPAVLVTMTSNGALLSEEMAGKLIESGADSINISIDAADPEMYRQARVGSDLEAVTNNIRTLGRLKRSHHTTKPGTGIAMVVGKDNIEQMPKVIELAAELGVGHVSIAPMDDFALTSDYKDRLNIENDLKVKGAESFAAAELVAKKKNINLIYEMPLQFFHFLGIKRDGYQAEDILFDNDLKDEEISRLGMQKGCQVPWRDSFVAHNGDVHPCCVSPRVLGNLKEQTFEEIWNGAKCREFRRRLKSCNTNDECRSCKRAIWNKVVTVESARDWMEVGRAEIHGLGWGPVGTDNGGRQYRLINRKATFFVRNSGKQYLAMTLGNEHRRIVIARVCVNNVEVGAPVVPYGWKTEHFDLSGVLPTVSGKCVNTQQELLMLGEAQDGLLRIEIELESDDMALKISGASLLDEEEIDSRTKTEIRNDKLPMSRLLNRCKAIIKHAAFYKAKIKKKFI